MGLAACPIPVALGSRYLHASLLLSTDTLLGLCPAWVCLSLDVSGCGNLFSLLLCVCLLHC